MPTLLDAMDSVDLVILRTTDAIWNSSKMSDL